MLKKVLLMVFAAMLLVAGIASANAGQVGGMQTLAGPALPAGLTVSVNPGGLGDSLIYGYYNAREALTFFRVVNTSTTQAVKARVRFREGKTSREILDFNICLTNKDQWSGWIYSPSTTGPAVVLPVDGGLQPSNAVKPGEYNDAPAGNQTRTSPVWPRPSAGSNLYSPVAFQHKGTNPGVLGTVTADDTKEGYFEIIGTVSKGTGTDTDASHIAFTQSECDNAISPIVPPFFVVDDVLGGTADIFVFSNTAGSGLYGYSATALAGCNVISDFDLLTEHPIWSDCNNGLAGVDYVLTKQWHVAMYELEDWGNAETAVILNFPTKGQHLNNVSVLDDKPFDTVDASTKCEPVTINIYNDLENTTTSQTGFSPQGVSSTPVLCNEVNVINLGKTDATMSNIMNSTLTATLNVGALSPVTGLGWVRIGLDTGAISCASGNSTCFPGPAGVHSESVGLPSLGYVIEQWVGTMGSMTPTKYNTSIR